MGRHAKKGCARTQRTEDGAMTDLRAKRSGGQILVVDDDKLIRGDITHMLQRILGGGAELLEAYDGRMAMQKLEASQAGIVLTDMRMPRMDGLALIEAARGRWPDLQFIVLSNYDDFDYVKQSFQHGIVDYTLKYQIDEPTLRELIERAREALEAYWREREYLEGMRKDTLYEESLRLGGEIAQCIESCTAPAFMERLRQPARIVRLDCLPREDAPGEWRRLAAAAFTGLFESDGRSELHPFVLPRKPGKEKLRMGVVACAQFVNPCALETTLRERVERFFQEPGGAACICAAALEPLESWDGALTARLDAAVGQIFYMRASAWAGPPSQTGGVLQACELHAAFASALLEGRREDALSIVGQTAEMLRKKRPDPHAARKLLGRFWWEVQAVLPPEEEQASHLAMQRLDSYERLLLETVGSLPMKPPALVTEGESAVEELIEGLLSDLSKPVSLDEAARRIGFSRAHFCRLFRQATGQSYNSFMTGKRIEQACVLLRRPRAQLRVVAGAVGFSDVRYFRKLFFQHMHMNVDEWVREAAGGKDEP